MVAAITIAATGCLCRIDPTQSLTLCINQIGGVFHLFRPFIRINHLCLSANSTLAINTAVSTKPTLSVNLLVPVRIIFPLRPILLIPRRMSG